MEDQEGSPEDSERRDVCVEYPEGVPGQDEGATELRSSRGVVRKAKEQEAGPQGHWGQEAWIRRIRIRRSMVARFGRKV